MLGQAKQQCVIQHPPLLKIVQQRTDRGIKTWQQFVSQTGEMIEMRIPRGVDYLVFIPENRNQLDPRFEQPAPSQDGLPEQRHTVLFSQ